MIPVSSVNDRTLETMKILNFRGHCARNLGCVFTRDHVPLVSTMRDIFFPDKDVVPCPKLYYWGGSLTRPQIVDVVRQMYSVRGCLGNALKGAGASLGEGFASGVASVATPAISGAAQSAAPSLAAARAGYGTALKEAGASLGEGFASGVANVATPALSGAAQSAAPSIAAARDGIGTIRSAISGLTSSVTEAVSSGAAFTRSCSALARSAMDYAKWFLPLASFSYIWYNKGFTSAVRNWAVTEVIAGLLIAGGLFPDNDTTVCTRIGRLLMERVNQWRARQEHLQARTAERDSLSDIDAEEMPPPVSLEPLPRFDLFADSKTPPLFESVHRDGASDDLAGLFSCVLTPMLETAIGISTFSGPTIKALASLIVGAKVVGGTLLDFFLAACSLLPDAIHMAIRSEVQGSSLFADNALNKAYLNLHNLIGAVRDEIKTGVVMQRSNLQAALNAYRGLYNRISPSRVERSCNRFVTSDADLVLRASLNMTVTARVQPVIVVLGGASQVGKSFLVDMFCAAHGFPPPWSVSWAAKHDDGYDNQPVVLFEEVTPTRIPQIVDRLLTMGTTTPLKMNCADLHGKQNTYFNSKYIFLSTNIAGPAQFTAAIPHQEVATAIRHRIMGRLGIWVDMRAREEFTTRVGGTSVMDSKKLDGLSVSAAANYEHAVLRVITSNNEDPHPYTMREMTYCIRNKGRLALAAFNRMQAITDEFSRTLREQPLREEERASGNELARLALAPKDGKVLREPVKRDSGRGAGKQSGNRGDRPHFRRVLGGTRQADGKFALGKENPNAPRPQGCRVRDRELWDAAGFKAPGSWVDERLLRTLFNEVFEESGDAKNARHIYMRSQMLTEPAAREYMGMAGNLNYSTLLEGMRVVMPGVLEITSQKSGSVDWFGFLGEPLAPSPALSQAYPDARRCDALLRHAIAICDSQAWWHDSVRADIARSVDPVYGARAYDNNCKRRRVKIMAVIFTRLYEKFRASIVDVSAGDFPLPAQTVTRDMLGWTAAPITVSFNLVDRGPCDAISLPGFLTEGKMPDPDPHSERKERDRAALVVSRLGVMQLRRTWGSWQARVAQLREEQAEYELTVESIWANDEYLGPKLNALVDQTTDADEVAAADLEDDGVKSTKDSVIRSIAKRVLESVLGVHWMVWVGLLSTAAGLFTAFRAMGKALPDQLQSVNLRAMAEADEFGRDVRHEEDDHHESEVRGSYDDHGPTKKQGKGGGNRQKAAARKAARSGGSNIVHAGIANVFQSGIPDSLQPYVAIRKNMVEISCLGQHAWGLVVQSAFQPQLSSTCHYVLVNRHLFMQDREYVPDGTMINVKVDGLEQPLEVAFRADEDLVGDDYGDVAEDVILWRMGCSSRSVGYFKDLRGRFLKDLDGVKAGLNTSSYLYADRLEPCRGVSFCPDYSVTTDETGLSLAFSPSVRSDNETRGGDCGLPVVSRTGEILAIHAGRVQARGYVSTSMRAVAPAITQSILRRWISEFDESLVVHQAVVPCLPETKKNLIQVMETVTDLPRDFPNFDGKRADLKFEGVVKVAGSGSEAKNKVLRTNVSNLLTLACVKRLSVVNSTQASEVLHRPVLPREFLSRALASKHLKAPKMPPPDVLSYGKIACYEDYKYLYTVKGTTLGLWDIPQCVGGTALTGPIDDRTGAGVPFNRFPRQAGQTGKKHILQKVDGVLTITDDEARMVIEGDIAQLAVGIRPYWISSTFPKTDELVSDSKYESALPRTIETMPLSNLIACRRYFGAFAEAMTASRFQVPAVMGLRPAKEWNGMVDQLLSVGQAFGSDVSKWDTRVTQHLAESWFLPFVNDWYRKTDRDWKVEDDRARSILITDLFNSKTVIGDMCYSTLSAMKSGSWLTTVLNTFLRSGVHACCWFTIFRDYKSPSFDPVRAYSQVFRKVNNLAFFLGDDCISATKPGCARIFTFKALQKAMLENFDVVLTPAKKGAEDAPYESVLDVDFLSCTSTYNVDARRYLPVLGNASLGGALSYVTPVLPMSDALGQNVHGVLLFLAARGRTEFDRLGRDVVQSVSHIVTGPQYHLDYDTAIQIWNRGLEVDNPLISAFFPG